MMILPKYVEQTQSGEPTRNVGDEADRYQGISDTELNEALDRRLRQINDLGQDTISPAGVSVVHEVEQIQGELLRRARARHPSSS